MTTISIITITYQAERSLPRTLQSVADQTYAAIEHLIIDGASTDGTLQLARDYQRDSRHCVKVVSERDRGLYDAMNKGLQQATGDYLVFLNAGDTLFADSTIETVADAVKEAERIGGRGVAVAYGDTAITDSEGRFLHMRQHRPPRQLSWRSFRWGMLVCHQAFYVRSDIARSESYDLQYRHSADVDWCIRVMKRAEQEGLQLVDTHATLANFEDGGDSTQHHRASLAERFKVMAHHYGWLTTLCLHAWFVVRMVVGRLRK